MKLSKAIMLAAAALAVTTTAQAQGTLSLEQVKEMALQHNIAVRSAATATEQAQEMKKEAHTAYFPQVSAMAGAFKTSRDIVKADISTADIVPSSLAAMIPAEMAAAIPGSISVSALDRGFNAAVSVVQPVYAGGRIVNSNKLAQVGVEASQLQEGLSRNTVLLTAETYYWQIVSLHEKARTLQAVSKFLAQLEHDASLAVQAGVGLRNDVLKVQLQQNSIGSDSIKLANGLSLAYLALGQYIGLDGQTYDVAQPADIYDLPPYPLAPVDKDQALQATNEYRLLQKNVEAAQLQVKLEKGKLLPQVGVGAGYGYYNMAHGMNNHTGMVFATVSVPISDWWMGKHNVKRQQLAEQNARDQLADNSQLLKIRMQKNWNDVDDAYKQLLLAKKSIEQSEENLRLNRDFYQAGTGTMSDLLDAQQQYQQCRDRYTDAYCQLMTRMVSYRQSIGQ